jgi:hypothetical protein
MQFAILIDLISLLRPISTGFAVLTNFIEEHCSKYCIIVQFHPIACTFARQPCPAALPSSLARQTCP